jgi:hypothetical protein
MKLTITDRLIGRGWSETVVTDGDRSVLVTAASLSDALADLSEAVLARLRGADRASCRFADEPGEHRWLFERRRDRLALTIRRFPTTFAAARRTKPARSSSPPRDAAPVRGPGEQPLQAMLEPRGRRLPGAVEPSSPTRAQAH